MYDNKLGIYQHLRDISNIFYDSVTMGFQLEMEEAMEKYIMTKIKYKNVLLMRLS